MSAPAAHARAAAPARSHAAPARAVLDGLLGASRVLVAIAARSLAHVDVEVTFVQYRTLVVLASRGPQRTADLAAELGVAPSTVTRMCDRLVGKRLVQRFRRADDRRAAWVGLTVEGRDLVGAIMRERRTAIARLLRDVPLAETESLAAALSAFVVAAGEVSEAEWWRRWRSSTVEWPDAVRA